MPDPIHFTKDAKVHLHYLENCQGHDMKVAYLAAALAAADAAGAYRASLQITTVLERKAG